MRLAKRDVLTIGRNPGAEIRVEEGVVWLTLDREPTDHVLKAGDVFRLDGRRAAIVSAFEDSRFQIVEPVAAAGHVAALLASLSRRLQPQG
jgi:hypothetical protein